VKNGDKENRRRSEPLAQVMRGHCKELDFDSNCRQWEI
jgi:hypothetical protein